uniref:tetratricopeptide repeat protein n=1 Tax=Duganella sp. TaxID=1904440 RepID=UPI0031DC8598
HRNLHTKRLKGPGAWGDQQPIRCPCRYFSAPPPGSPVIRGAPLLLKAWNEVDLNGIEQHAVAWHSQEPFSSRPIQLLSSLYAYRGSHIPALKWLEAGLKTDPTDQGLLINLAFVHASMGSEDKAKSTLKRLRQIYGREIEPFAIATEGLLAYQLQQFTEGDNLYTQAATEFSKRGDPALGAFCRLNQAFLAAERHHPASVTVAKTAFEEVRSHPSADSHMLLKIRFPDQKMTLPEETQELRKLTQWTFDRKSNALIEKPGVTAKNAKPLIILGDDD